ncbi:3-hydroxyacyl-CoA dehydrogenase family protein [Photorhabdus tasmaniensis]|uniref:3-hydroxyacyl-CoA dehydrogenase family protein n=1 Tax=Photorhabdus tasmaniensis TaxID=1004159 RepID=UPI004041B1DD
MSKLKIAVVGGGNIGSSLAFDCALRGHDVVVIEKDALSCEQSRARITETAGYAPLFSPLAKGKAPEEMLSNIMWSQDLQSLSDCVFVVENITENIELKQSLYARMSEFIAPLGKKAVVVKDGSGFVSNRISHLFMNEAAFTIQDGVAQPADVDAIFKECFGHMLIMVLKEIKI